MRCADAGDSARNNLAALGNERLQHSDVLVIDVIDLLDAEPANLLAPEILFLSHRGCFVATGRALRSRNRSSTSLFSHVQLSFSSVGSATATGAPGAG